MRQKFYLMFLSREIHIKLWKKIILYTIRSIKQIIFNKYATTISQRSLRNSSLLLLLFEFNINDIIDNIFMRLEHVTRTPTNCSAVLLSHVSVCIIYCTAIGGSYGHVMRTYILRFGIILTQFYVNFSEYQIDVL